MGGDGRIQINRNQYLTYIDALQWKFRLAVVRDAVGDRNNEAHEANLCDLGLKYADVVENNEILGI